MVWKKGAKLNFPAPFFAEFPHLMSWNFKKIFDTHIFYVIALFFPFVEMQCGSRKWSFHLNWHRFLFPKTHYYCSIYQESDGLKDCCSIRRFHRRKIDWLMYCILVLVVCGIFVFFLWIFLVRKFNSKLREYFFVPLSSIWWCSIILYVVVLLKCWRWRREYILIFLQHWWFRENVYRK